MKRFASAALAAATIVAPLATPEFAAAQQYGQDNNQNNDRDRNNQDHHDRNNQGNQNDRGNQGNDRWDRSQHNGYSWRGRWHYGPPPTSYYGRAGFSPGYRAWRRGERLPSYYRNSYQVVDYRTYHLRRPPHGYRYVRDDRGQILLVAIASGLILSAILSNN